jgi:hypothetical protein
MNQPIAPGDAHHEAMQQQLAELAKNIKRRASRAGRWASFWQVTDITLGLATAVLAATAGATGLASTAGRVPAAILALIAAGLTAASKFLECRARYERNRKRRNALHALERDVHFAKASEGCPGAVSPCDAVRNFNYRLTVIGNMDHDSVPAEALGLTAESPVASSEKPLVTGRR